LGYSVTRFLESSKFLPLSNSEPEGKDQNTANEDNTDQAHRRVFEEALNSVKIVRLTAVHSAESV
jgi:hypothetical protein